MKKLAFAIAAVGALAIATPALAQDLNVQLGDGHHRDGDREMRHHDGDRDAYRHRHSDRVVIIRHDRDGRHHRDHDRDHSRHMGDHAEH